MNYAGFWVRLGAYLIDGILMYFANLIIGTMFGVSIGAMSGFDEAGAGTVGTGAVLVAYVVMSVANIAYFAVFESSARQATPGKMALGLIVTDSNGDRISFGRALGRYFAKFISSIILLIGFIMIGFTERKQGLHDMIAGTLVLKGKPGEGRVNPDVFA